VLIVVPMVDSAVEDGDVMPFPLVSDPLVVAFVESVPSAEPSSGEKQALETRTHKKRRRMIGG